MKATISRDEIKARMESGASMTLVEALPEKFYRSGHLPGAINIPLAEVEASATELLPDRDALIVVYCARALEVVRVHDPGLWGVARRPGIACHGRLAGLSA